MADLSLQDYGTVQAPNMLDTMTKQAQMEKYSLDAAKEAREFNALRQHGAGAAAGDPSSIEALASKAPTIAGQFATWMQTRTATDQAKDNMAKSYAAQVAQIASQFSDPEQQKAILNKGIDLGVQQGHFPQAKADFYKGMVASGPEGIRAIIHGALAAAQTPVVAGQVAGQTAEAEYPTKSALTRQEGSYKPPVTIPNIIEKDANGNPTGRIISKSYPATEQPGAIPGGGGFLGSRTNQFGVPMLGPGVPAGPAGGTGAPSRAPGPRSDTGAPRATPASYASPIADDSAGSENEYGAASQTLPQSAYKNRLFGQESGNRDVPNAMKSSASGLGQFTDETWKDQMQKLIPDQIAGMSDAQIKALKSDTNLQHAATMSLAEDNVPVLAKAGVPVDAATLAMAHKIGAGGVIKAFNSDPNGSMADVLRAGKYGEQAVQKNPTWARQSVAGFVNSHYNAFGNKPVAGIGGAPPTGVAPGATVPAPSAAMLPPAERSGRVVATAAATAPGASAATPAAPEPVPASSAAVWTPGTPNTGSFTYGGGDSIGLGIIKNAGVPGTTAPITTAKGAEHADGVGSRNPQQALDFIQAHPDRFEGQDVIWSTGLMNSGGVKNAEKNLELVGNQIDAMKEAKANNIVIAGVDQGKYLELNDKLEALTKEKGVQFAGPLPTTDIHPPNAKAYKDYVQNATRTLEQKRSEAEPGPQDTVENPPGSVRMLQRSDLQNVADVTDVASGSTLPPADILLPTPGTPRGGVPTAAPAASPDAGIEVLTPAQEKLQEQKLLEPGKLYEQGVSAQQTAKATADQNIQNESRAQSEEAHISMQQLHQISTMLDQTTTGMTAPIRQKFMSAFAEFARLAGRPDTDAGREAARLALVNTAGSELAFSMVKALGSREAQQVVQQVMNIKPNIMLSNEENKMIIASLKQGFQRAIDRHDFIMDNKDKMGIDRAEHAFNKANPVEVYASKVVPFPYPDNPDDLKKNVIYNTKDTGHKFDKGKWDGDNFQPVR